MPSPNRLAVPISLPFENSISSTRNIASESAEMPVSRVSVVEAEIFLPPRNTQTPCSAASNLHATGEE
jgi:hypothetical protein